MAGIYASATRERSFRRHRTPYVGWVIMVFFCIVLLFLSSLMTGSYKQARKELLEVLTKENEVIERNNKLKTDLSGVTQTRLLELKAKERLGLEKPRDEEVLVLR
ncbi:MAG TPA: hypothetical protein VHO84_08050 [Syntrophorhabdaceae bacterium]|nr:hypothetical protein [Syntrophorhabdaceae bacterium]